MKRNSRLSLALHTLGHMAADPTCAQTSTDIAAHAGTNPVVVRRVLGQLRKAGLLTSEKGQSGGWRLARSPREITLADVYLALEERLAPTPDPSHASNCSVEHVLQNKVASVMADVEKSLIQRLSETTIAEVRD